ncbi:tyrosine-type recombinase/integrase [Bradyrhizobium sp. NDS-1]|uniref:site-specific integrase n=1 Tax=Bradyrhizobium sp. NDS-1 TaxID=3080014 RepID=UPI00293E9632|nr:tyrosine-type recombinase/integrase [Bradyrhizobium sp. NDS-1]WOH70662.1 tyrosine-type recombinase/integrase [Bradyrhizobium sp. NDS-1]
MKGHIRQRGKRSFELKFDAGRDPATGKRKVQYHSFRGTKREAQVKLAELIASVSQAKYVEPNKVTVAEWVRGRVDHWEAAGVISARTAERYRELVENQIVPHLGARPLQKLRTLDIESWHTTLRNGGRADGKGGLAPRTIGHAHRVLGKALRDATKNELVIKNVVADESAPKVDDEEMVIVKDVPAFIETLRGHRLFVPAMISLFTGMRLGEVLGIRWGRLDLDKKIIQVREAIEETKAHGIRLKAPKTKAGRRDITLPDLLVETLRDFRKEQLELRLKLGAGRLPDDALLFAGLDGALPSQKRHSKAWSDFQPEMGFHNLRHTHASQLIDAGVDIVTISKRLGHAKPDITLRVYSHLFRNDDSKAAAAINAALSG